MICASLHFSLQKTAFIHHSISPYNNRKLYENMLI